MARITSSPVLPVACGALAGALNAAACWADWPVAIPDAEFAWHIVPAGAAHGAVLVATALLGRLAMCRAPRALAWSAGPVLGWLAGYVSWMPIFLSIDGGGSPLAWPFGGWMEALLTPWQAFGFVAWAWYWSLLLPGSGRTRRVLGGVVAGAIGSAWFWSAMQVWYLCLLHGAAWGLLVGQAEANQPKA